MKDLAAKADRKVKSWTDYVTSSGTMRAARLVDVDPNRGYALGPGLGLVLSFVVGAERLVGALVDAGGTARCIVREPFVPAQLKDPPHELLARMARVGDAVLELGLDPEHGLAIPTRDGEAALRLIGATAAWPSPMTQESQPKGGPMHPGWQARTFREHLCDELGLPLDRCHAINDANAGALTLAFEQAEPRAGAIMCVHLAAGIGLGTVHQAIPKPQRLAFIDAHLVGGRDNVAGEIGHCVLEAGVVEKLNQSLTKHTSGAWSALKPLDGQRYCGCRPGAQGHLEAVVGAEAVLDRLGRYHPKVSQAQLLQELHREAGNNPLVQTALEDVGRAVASVLAGAVAATDPVTIELVGALASQYVADGMNEQLRGYGVADRVAFHARPDGELVALRGAALAVLRGGLYRGLFDRIRWTRDDARFPEDWEGWETAPEGAQSGETAQSGSAWHYRPIPINRDWIDARAERRDATRRFKRTPDARPAG